MAPQTVRELEDEIEEEFKKKFEEEPHKEKPMFIKSTCCGQALLLSMKELVPVLEDQIGLRCDEAYLEDSAIRFLKDCFLRKKCTCQAYRFIFVDLDDPTISLKRFKTTVNQICADNGVKIGIYGCSQSEGRSKNQCIQAGAEFLLKPITAFSLKAILPN
jgi:hypothetical protein